MAVAPEPYFSACMAVLREAILTCRIWGWSENVPAGYFATLMDAVHNIPDLIQHWEHCDVERLRRDLTMFHPDVSDVAKMYLLDIFDSTVAKHGLPEAENAANPVAWRARDVR